MRIQIGLVSLGLLVGACDFNKKDDYNPKKDFEDFEAAQSAQANANKSTKPVDPAVAALEDAKKTFGVYCSSCHGIDGMANTPTASALNPKPRNFTDAAWQDSVDDAHIAKVVKEGGASVGLSPTMAPWGGALKDEQIAGIVKYLRTFKK